MKIYLYRYGSICEPDVIDAFKRLGFEVDEETAEMSKKNMTPSECVQIAAAALSQGFLNQTANNSDSTSSTPYTFVFSINFFPWLSDVCSIFKIPYLSLIVDSPVLELYSNSLKNQCNRVFLFDRALYDEFAPKNPECIFHIPLSTNCRRSEKVIQQASERTRKKYSCRISLIGSTYEEKCEFNKAVLPPYEKGYAAGIIEAQLKVYGCNFIEAALSDSFVETFMKSVPDVYQFPQAYEGNNKALVAQQYLSVKVAEQERIRALRMLSEAFPVDFYTRSDTSSIPRIHNKGFAKSLTEMPLIFHESKINLNITAKSIRSGLSLRIFDVLGCGGFLITNYQAELPELFEIGTDLVAYESMEHLKELCAYYLTHEEERKAIAQNGYEKVKKFHTYDIRLVQMLDMAFPKK